MIMMMMMLMMMVVVGIMMMMRNRMVLIRGRFSMNSHSIVGRTGMVFGNHHLTSSLFSIRVPSNTGLKFQRPKSPPYRLIRKVLQ